LARAAIDEWQQTFEGLATQKGIAMRSRKLANTVARILRQPGLRNMGFDLNGLCVTGQRFAMVAKAIADGSIACEAVDSFKPQVGPLAPGMVTVARYDSDADTILFSRENYGTSEVREELNIVHEATHALFDLFARSKFDRRLSIDDESAAVLASALYIRLCNKDPGTFTILIDGPQDEALKLADSLMKETHGFAQNRTYFLKPQQTEKLRTAVAQQWNLVKPDSNGPGTQYIYDGVKNVVNCFPCWVHGTSQKR